MKAVTWEEGKEHLRAVPLLYPTVRVKNIYPNLHVCPCVRCSGPRCSKPVVSSPFLPPAPHPLPQVLLTEFLC